MTPNQAVILGDILGEVRERLARIETKVDAIPQDHEARLLKVEGRQQLIASVGAALLFIVTFFQDRIASIIA